MFRNRRLVAGSEEQTRMTNISRKPAKTAGAAVSAAAKMRPAGKPQTAARPKAMAKPASGRKH